MKDSAFWSISTGALSSLQIELKGVSILQNILDLIEDEYQFGRQVTMFQLVTSSPYTQLESKMKCQGIKIDQTFPKNSPSRSEVAGSLTVTSLNIGSSCNSRCLLKCKSMLALSAPAQVFSIQELLPPNRSLHSPP